jgi:UDP-N-acetylglucosamine 2-epimerase
MKKIMTVVGTRPEMIRLALIIRKIDKYFDHTFVHTGQNYDQTLHDQFFDDLDLRRPDIQLNTEVAKFGFDFIGNTLSQMAVILDKVRPDAALILGDTNSGLSAYVCKQKDVPVFHMEAGNRCYDDHVPEEVNRRIIDTCSTYLLTYTDRSREQLLAENYHPSRIIVTGNPIREVLEGYGAKAESRADEILKEAGINPKRYILATIHRNENITNKAKLSGIIEGLRTVAEQHVPIILSLHPKMKDMLSKFGLTLGDGILPSKPFSFSEFIILMKNSSALLSDSGTVPEEACILKVPCVLVRTSTERPELLETNAMVLAGTKASEIVASVKIAMDLPIGRIPHDYEDLDVSDKIVKLLNRHIE